MNIGSYGYAMDDLTVGKLYDATNCEFCYNCYTIKNDNNIEDQYSKSYFKPLAEIIKERNDIINKLLVE